MIQICFCLLVTVMGANWTHTLREEFKVHKLRLLTSKPELLLQPRVSLSTDSTMKSNFVNTQVLQHGKWFAAGPRRSTSLLDQLASANEHK